MRQRRHGWRRRWRGWGKSKVGLRDWLFGRRSAAVPDPQASEDSLPAIVTGIAGVGEKFGFRFDLGDDQCGWSFGVHLCVWRIEGGPLVATLLRLEHSLPSETALNRWIEAVPTDRPIRFRLTAPPELSGERYSARIAEYLGEIADSELAQLAEPILRPPPFVHPQLGQFKPAPSLPSFFEGSAMWRGQEVGLTLILDGAGRLDDRALDFLNLCDHADRWQAMVEDAIYEHLFELWDDNWRDEAEPSLSRAQWLGRMRLVDISVSENEQVSFEYDDGNLFWGHRVSVSGSLEGGIVDATI
jgi:hypothetical protein